MTSDLQAGRGKCRPVDNGGTIATGAAMLPDMTHPLRHADDDGREDEVLRIYADDPMEDGDAVLLLDGTVCLVLAGMADEWNDAGRRNLVEVLVETSQRVLVAIARHRGELMPDDYRLWRELHQSLRGTDVELLPVRALPAA